VRIAVVGGTGDFGLALAQRLVEAGHDVVVGSRDAARAAAKAAGVGAAGATNEDAVRGAGLVVLAVKAEAALSTAESLADSLGGDVPVLSVASELRFTKQGVLPGEDARSIAERTQALLRAPVVSGLHSLAAASLAHGKAEGDALVCGDHPDAKEIVLELAGAVVTGRALDAGPLASSRALEGMTAVIVNLNKRYRAHAGVQITGLT
jgi:8-hydroxy-5-deazaflavin:NADPH oxidoreductase